MNATTIAVDLAKSVFELGVADAAHRVIDRQRLSRSAFMRWFENRTPATVVMEACGSAHFWGRWLTKQGFEVRLLPPAYVRPYRRRSKTDRSDVNALLEAARAPDIHPVAIKSEDQQALQGLHRIRSLCMADRTARINTLRGLLREFGLIVPEGAVKGLRHIGAALADIDNVVPGSIRPVMLLLLEQIEQLELHIAQIERTLALMAKDSEPCRQLLSVPGVGLISATAVLSSCPPPAQFQSARHFAAWLGLTPREYSSGETRRLGRLSKQGDRYLRTLLTHGARAVLLSAHVARKRTKPLTRLQQWALNLEARAGHNKTACALANKIARIAFACWRDGAHFNAQPTVTHNAIA